jgi:hypothetical protein
MSQDPAKLDRAQLEVVNLHRFFEEWLAGRLPDTDVAFERCVTAMATQFELIVPSGERLTRTDLLESLRGVNGSRGADFRLWVDELATRPIAGGVHLVTYQEWQTHDGRTTGRLSTAILADSAGAADGIEWWHVHESWLPGHAPR